ncbi:chemotaxis protein CheA [Aliamphritea spongicola]|uniref:chemotaxis protein CheA n=1 Tax=Aliamphritea spongicola TaxID=707589 RepID=UPI00196A7467|nr:chemotaxis protein CheA [Aliamphritea spongicola]MBN3564068.1 chemotaxis protein CheA [Aliamphritea spongicola]
MSIDLSQFIATFLEESYEGLEVMESSLLDMDSADEETINTIFRAAHSIKGGAGTFGFNEVADFTHRVETLLDEMRSGKQAVTGPLVNLLLESVDCIKALLESVQGGADADPDMLASVQKGLEMALGESSEEAPAEPPLDVLAEIVEVADQPSGWLIDFQPHRDLLQQGHEPAFMFEALGDFGDLSIQPDCTGLPALAELNPELLHINWQIELTSDCSDEDVKEIFEWVEDECDLSVSPLCVTPPAGWRIEFIPGEDIVQTGNEPSLMLDTLTDLGELTVEANLSNLPSLADLNPELIYLSWQLTLESDCDEDAVREIFEWVEDDCEINVSALAGAESTAPVTDTQPAAEITETVPESAPVSEPATPVPAAASEPAAKVTPAAADKTPAARKPKATESSSIRVDTDKIDALINRVGELVITQAMLGQIGQELMESTGADIERLQSGLEQLERNTRDLQEDVMRVRMLPISFVFNRFPRLVHDVSGKLGKKVDLVISGEQTEIDKTVMEKIGDPLVHLIRNSLDHGLETPEERLAAGKDETGTVQLNAYHQGGVIVIDIIDDGRGLNTARIRQKALENGLITEDQVMTDQEIDELIFKPGFSTAEEVSDLSGRGVGMDVVRRNIESLGGNVSVRSDPGNGAKFSVSLPLTLAILDGQLVRIHDQTYILPLVSIVETFQADKKSLSPIAGENKLLHFRDEYIPLISMRALFKLPPEPKEEGFAGSLIAIVENGGQKVGLVVDELYGQQQVVIKSLEVNFKPIEGFAGATILGDGSVALILDVTGIIKRGLSAEVAHSANTRNGGLQAVPDRENVA